MQNIKPSIYALLNIIKDKTHIEKYILYKNCQFEEFDKYWAPWSRFNQFFFLSISFLSFIPLSFLNSFPFISTFLINPIPFII